LDLSGIYTFLLTARVVRLYMSLTIITIMTLLKWVAVN